jgi:PAS domain S-box-containing protein
VTSGEHPAPAAPDDEDRALRLAERDLIRERFRFFAVAWCGSSLLWLLVLVVGPLSALPWAGAVAAATVQGLTLSAAVLVAVRAGSPAVARAATLAGLASAGLVWTVAIGLGGVPPEILVFVFQTLFLGAPLFFAWSWRAQLLLIVTIVAPTVLWLQYIGSASVLDTVPVAIVGAVIALLLAVRVRRDFRARVVLREQGLRAQQALADSHRAYRALAESARDFIWTCDLEGRLTYVNEAIVRFSGLPLDRLIGLSVATFLTDHPANDVVRIPDTLADAPPIVVTQVNTPHGRRWFEALVSPIREADGRVSGLRGITRDVTERWEAEEALRASLVKLGRREEQLRLLAQRQVQVREEERRRLGFDLHDDVCQELVGIGILVESVRRRLGPDEQSSLDLLGRIGRHLDALSEHLRLLARELRPMLLHDLGLEDSLRSLAGGMSSPTTRVIASFPIAIPRLGEEVEVAVYRVAQEAVTNALRHARATTVTVTLGTVGDMLSLEVHDDGCGFDPAERRRDALGLVSMEERALALGGHVEVRAAPGDGTIVRFLCPKIHRVPQSAA